MTMLAGVGIGLHKDPGEAAKEAIFQAKANIRKETADLAIVFCSSGFANSGVLKILADSLGVAPLIGCSAAAVISNYGILQHGLAVMLIAFPEDIHFNTACALESEPKNTLKMGEELGEKLLYGFQGVRRNLSLTFSDGLMENKTDFIYGLQEKLGQSFPLVGASASDNLRFQKTEIYFNHQVLDNAACGLLLGGKLNFGLGIKHGWKPLGKPRYVTKAGNNILYEIDNKPAADIYKEYLASNIKKLRQELKHISVLYPIGIRLVEEEEYLLRNVMSIEEDGTLILHGEIQEGNEIRLMIGTKESCFSAAQQAAEEVKKGLHNQQADFIIVLDSVSRYILLGRQAAKEIEIIKKELGKDTPIIGIYTYGEQAPLKAINYQGRAYFHNQTMAILGLRAAN